MTGPSRHLHHHTVLAIIVVAAVAMIAAACDKSPAGPSAPSSARTVALSLAGQVVDPLRRPVAEATVEVLDGVLAGQSVATDGDGRFAFAGQMAADVAVDLRITKLGYATSTATWRASNPGDVVVFLRPFSIPAVQGDYTLTFTADVSCNGLPSQVRSRSYSATVSSTSSPTFITITLAGATFAPGYADLSGSLAKDAVRFNVFSNDADNWWGDGLPIIERLDSTSYVSFAGTANATVADANAPIDAAFDGTIAYCSAAIDPTIPNYPPTCAVPPVECKSTQNRLSLTRR